MMRPSGGRRVVVASTPEERATMKEARDLTPYERFVEATKRVLSVPRRDLDKAMQEWRKRRDRTRGRKRKP